MIKAPLRVDGTPVDLAPEELEYLHISLPAEQAESDPYALLRCEHCGARLRTDEVRSLVDELGSSDCEEDPERECVSGSPDCDGACAVGTHSAEPAPLAWARSALVELLETENGISFEVEFADLPGSVVLTLWRDRDGVDLRLEVPGDPNRDSELVMEPVEAPGQFRVRER